MNALLLNGAQDNDEALARAQRLLTDALERAGWQADALELRGIDITPCTGCFGCWVRTPGECVLDDPARDVARRAARSDLLAFLTPLTFGGYSSQLKKAVDRLVPLVSPFFMQVNGETHHKPRYRRYPRLLGLGIADAPDASAAELFATIVQRNALNLHAPGHAARVVARGAEEAGVRDAVQALLQEAGV